MIADPNAKYPVLDYVLDRLMQRYKDRVPDVQAIIKAMIETDPGGVID